jgi:membrane protease YdiL (CAAX protease family)
MKRERLSRTRLATALALTALPVLLTSIIMRSIAGSDGMARMSASGHSAYVAFAVYAIANWLTFALVLAIVGAESLRGHGLRLAFDQRRLGLTVAAFVAGLAVYGVVTGALRATGLPAMKGMDYAPPGPLGTGVLLASAVLTAAWCEEIFFRVLWIGALRQHVPSAVAVAASLAAFAAIHWPYFGLGGIVFISVWALLPIALFLTFGDISASVGMHVLNNTFAYVVVPLLLR